MAAAARLGSGTAAWSFTGDPPAGMLPTIRTVRSEPSSSATVSGEFAAPVVTASSNGTPRTGGSAVICACAPGAAPGATVKRTAFSSTESAVTGAAYA